MKILAIIIAVMGTILVCGGGFGIMEGDPAGLVLWIPGIILSLLGLIIGRAAKKRQERSDKETKQ